MSEKEKYRIRVPIRHILRDSPGIRGGSHGPGSPAPGGGGPNGPGSQGPRGISQNVANRYSNIVFFSPLNLFSLSFLNFLFHFILAFWLKLLAKVAVVSFHSSCFCVFWLKLHG